MLGSSVAKRRSWSSLTVSSSILGSVAASVVASVVAFVVASVVLFVEDEEKIRTSLAGVMEDVFKSVILAGNGDEGLKKFKKYNPDVIIKIVNNRKGYKSCKKKDIERVERYRDGYVIKIKGKTYGIYVKFPYIPY